jgi:diguanylate cyclase (GGDEF)-like protein
LRQLFWAGTALLALRLVLLAMDPRQLEPMATYALLDLPTTGLPSHWQLFLSEPLATVVDMVTMISAPLIWPVTAIATLWERLTLQPLLDGLGGPTYPLFTSALSSAGFTRLEVFQLFPGAIQPQTVVALISWMLLAMVVPMLLKRLEGLYWRWWTEWQYYLQRQAKAESDLVYQQQAMLNMSQNLEAMKSSAVSLHRENITDHLTQLYNKRFFHQQLEASVNKALGGNHGLLSSMGLMMLDIDHFKQINDTYGHAVGDLVLADVAVIIRKHTPQGCYACRYGGEEFAVVLPVTSTASLVSMGDVIRHEVSLLRWDGFPELSCTISQGAMMLADLTSDALIHDQAAKALLEGADKQLYRAKQGGRNQLCLPDNAHTV